MATLNGTKSFTEVDCVFSIGQHLEFDVLCSLDVLLNEDSLITKSRLGSGLTELESTLEFVGFLNDLHTDAAAACCSFDELTRICSLSRASSRREY